MVMRWLRPLAPIEPHYPKVGPKSGDLAPPDNRIDQIVAKVHAKVDIRPHCLRLVTCSR